MEDHLSLQAGDHLAGRGDIHQEWVTQVYPAGSFFIGFFDLLFNIHRISFHITRFDWGFMQAADIPVTKPVSMFQPVE